MDAIAGAAPAGPLAGLLAGVLAGLGVAMPLGAVGVLLLQTAMGRGWRPAAGGALGIALVDTGYAAVALAGGAAVSSALAGRERAVQLIGAAVLLVVAVRGLAAAHTQAHLPPTPTAARPTAARPTAGPAGPGAWRTGVRFLGLTAVNPLTAVYFAALAAGTTSLTTGAATATAFVGGVLASSLLWQVLLVTVGALAGARLGRRARVITATAGHLVVLGYAAHLTLG